MKRRMRCEFETKLNSALIHSQLMKRKRLANETLRQYVYAINTIASQASKGIEEEALMQYIIDGVSDDESNKAILYNANTITELRKNLERYDRIREKAGRKNRRRVKERRRGKARRTQRTAIKRTKVRKNHDVSDVAQPSISRQDVQTKRKDPSALSAIISGILQRNVKKQNRHKRRKIRRLTT